MSHTRPFSVVRELSAATVAQFFGSDRGTGFAHDSAAYLAGSNFLRETTDTGFAVMPTQASPFFAICRPSMCHPRFRSNRFEGLSISTIALPLNFDRLAGLRIITRVV